MDLSLPTNARALPLEPEHLPFLQVPPCVVPELPTRRTAIPLNDSRVRALLAEVCAETGSDLIKTEVMPDRVHMLVDCGPQFGTRNTGQFPRGQDVAHTPPGTPATLFAPAEPLG